MFYHDDHSDFEIEFLADIPEELEVVGSQHHKPENGKHQFRFNVMINDSKPNAN